MSFFDCKRTKDSYYDKIRVKSSGTVYNTKYAIKCFERFLEKKYHKNSNEIIEELLEFEHLKRENTLFDLLQDFINDSHAIEIQPVTIKNYFSAIKGYLNYCGLRIHQEDIRQNLTFPRQVKEEKHPLSKAEIIKILDYASPKRKVLYLTLLSSAMRIEEACAIRKRDFDESLSRIQIKIPAKFTKAKKARTTFISKEAEKYVKPILNKINPDKLVFTENPDRRIAKLIEESYFSRLRKKAGLIEKYDSGVHKITLHSFRAYFISAFSGINESIGHALAGHERYMDIYDRFSDEEKLEKYLEGESKLLIFDNTPNEKYQKKIIEMEEKLNNLNRFAIDGIGEYNQNIRDLKELVQLACKVGVSKEPLCDGSLFELEKKLSVLNKDYKTMAQVFEERFNEYHQSHRNDLSN